MLRILTEGQNFLRTLKIVNAATVEHWDGSAHIGMLLFSLIDNFVNEPEWLFP